MGTSDIAYQNKEIVSKILADNFKNKSLAVYGLNIPKIVKVLPTNLPEISANELRIDHIFELEDKTVCIIDYESSYTGLGAHISPVQDMAAGSVSFALGARTKRYFCRRYGLWTFRSFWPPHGNVCKMESLRPGVDFSSTLPLRTANTR